MRKILFGLPKISNTGLTSNKRKGETTMREIYDMNLSALRMYYTRRPTYKA